MKRKLTVIIATVTLSTVVAAPATARPALLWGPCADAPDDPAMTCATLTVPVDWHDPSGPTIGLAVARRAATDPTARIGSLMINPGGPGGSGVDFAINGTTFFSDELRSRFDLIGFDPRGVRRSHPVLCSRDLVLGRPLSPPDSQADFDALVAHNQALADDCREHTGPLVDHLDMVSVVKDMDALRAALGERKLTFYGVSYGSLNAQQYAELYPDRVRAIVADSNMDHSLDTRGFLTTSAATIEASWTAFTDWCGRTESCALHGRDVSALWQDLLAREARGELPDPFDPEHRPNLKEGDLIGLTFGAFYRPAWPELAELLDAIDAGRTIPRDDQPQVPGNPPEQGDVIESPDAAILCSDYALPVRDFRQYSAYLAEQHRFAPNMRYSPAGLQSTTDCVGRQASTANPQHPLRVHGLDTPLLLINSRYDPATGYNWATNAARQLGREAVLVTYDGAGHAAYGRSECTRSTVDSYLIALAVPARGTHCSAVEPGTEQRLDVSTEATTSGRF
jgi:pimeloyl-ACP methyl ester carboxylesterase